MKEEKMTKCRVPTQSGTIGTFGFLSRMERKIRQVNLVHRYATLQQGVRTRKEGEEESASCLSLLLSLSPRPIDKPFL